MQFFLEYVSDTVCENSVIFPLLILQRPHENCCYDRNLLFQNILILDKPHFNAFHLWSPPRITWVLDVSIHPIKKRGGGRKMMVSATRFQWNIIEKSELADPKFLYNMLIAYCLPQALNIGKVHHASRLIFPIGRGTFLSACHVLVFREVPDILWDHQSRCLGCAWLPTNGPPGAVV